MPSWQPNWSDVDFDYGGAGDAVQRARRCIGILEARPHALNGAIAEARQEWRGRHRTQFDETEETIERQSRNLIDALRTAEFQVQTSIEEALAEQARRVSDRARWHEEAALEAEAARQAAEAAARRAAEEAARRPPTGTTIPT